MARPRLFSRALAVLAVPLGLVAFTWVLLPGESRGGPIAFTNRPAAASLAEEIRGGEQSPFYPSPATTADGLRLPVSAVTEAQSCGRSGCHPREVAEWRSSAHRFSGADNPWYRASLEAFRADQGAPESRWCAGCHNPAALLAGVADLPPAELADHPAGQAGVTCLSCHGVSAVGSTAGNGDYEITGSALHRLATDGSPLGRLLHDAALRLKPAAHRAAYRPAALTRTPDELCATCHKQQYDRPVNDYRYLSVMNDYDPWQSGSWSGQSLERVLYFPEPRGCVDCHMPPGEGGRRSHRFAAGHASMAALRSDADQLAAVEEALAGGAVRLDLVAMTRPRPAGEPLPVDFVEPAFGPLDRIPAALHAGEETALHLVVRPSGVGHLFPGGKTDLGDAWIELTVRDAGGRTIFASGWRDAEGHADPGSHFFRSWWIDEQSQVVARGNLWDARALIYNRRIEPNAAQVVRYRLRVPADARGPLALEARLLYRTFRPDFHRWAFESLGRTPPEQPVIEMARVTATLAVAAPGAPLPAFEEPAAVASADLPRWNDYAIGLALQGDFRAAREVFRQVTRIDPRQVDAWINLGRLAVVAGDLAEARATLGRALELAPGQPRAELFLGLTERAAGDFPRALELLGRVARRYPRDVGVRSQIANVLFQQNDLAGAGRELEAVLAVAPHDRAALLTLARIERARGNPQKAASYQALFERFKDDETVQNLTRPYLQQNPHDNLERQRGHEHVSTSPPSAPETAE